MKKVYFETYGCQMNKAESEAMASILAENRWESTDRPEDADAVIIHTCSVRKSAEQRVWGRLGDLSAAKAARKNRPFTLAVVGCMAQRLGDDIRMKFPAVDAVIGTDAKMDILSYIDGSHSGNESVHTHHDQIRYLFPENFGYEGQYHAFLPIMHGCNNFCTYCIVPMVRGREVSRPPTDILGEVEKLAKSGVKEITLLGQNVNSYLSESGGQRVDFPSLMEMVLAVKPEVEWIRFLTSHPKDFSPRLISLIADNPRLCSHIHLPLQSGSSRILEKMNRRYSREDYLRLVDAIRGTISPVTLSTDLIVGFPGESDDDYKETLSALDKISFDDAFTYKYNSMEGTAASEWPDQVDESVKQERLSSVIEFQREITRRNKMSRLGTRCTALVQGVSRKNSDEYLAKTEYNDTVIVPRRDTEIGKLYTVQLEELKGSTLKGEIIWSPGN